jgi:hypothetical protein
MIYEEVVLGVQVDWKTVPSNQVGNVASYQSDKCMGAIPSTLETCLPPTIQFLQGDIGLGSSLIYSYHSLFFFSIGTTNTSCSQNNNSQYLLYSRSASCDEWLNCLTPLGTKFSLIIIEHKQSHECSTIGCCGSDDILLAIWHNRQ